MKPTRKWLVWRHISMVKAFQWKVLVQMLQELDEQRAESRWPFDLRFSQSEFHEASQKWSSWKWLVERVNKRLLKLKWHPIDPFWYTDLDMDRNKWFFQYWFHKNQSIHRKVCFLLHLCKILEKEHYNSFNNKKRKNSDYRQYIWSFSVLIFTQAILVSEQQHIYFWDFLGPCWDISFAITVN